MGEKKGYPGAAGRQFQKFKKKPLQGYRGSSSVQNSNNTVNLIITNLLPYSYYDRYCTSLSLKGSTMPIGNILQTKKSIRTLCCKYSTIDM
jgi:hypothetical protein